jgi:hypothetical protein
MGVEARYATLATPFALPDLLTTMAEATVLQGDALQVSRPFSTRLAR